MKRIELDYRGKLTSCYGVPSPYLDSYWYKEMKTNPLDVCLPGIMYSILDVE